MVKIALCNPMDYTGHGILQARILEWEPFPSPGDLPNPGIEPGSPALWQMNKGRPQDNGAKQAGGSFCSIQPARLNIWGSLWSNEI